MLPRRPGLALEVVELLNCSSSVGDFLNYIGVHSLKTCVRRLISLSAFGLSSCNNTEEGCGCLYARNGECDSRICNRSWECLALNLRLEFVLGGYTGPSGALKSPTWDSVSIEEGESTTSKAEFISL